MSAVRLAQVRVFCKQGCVRSLTRSLLCDSHVQKEPPLQGEVVRGCVTGGDSDVSKT